MTGMDPGSQWSQDDNCAKGLAWSEMSDYLAMELNQSV